MRLLLLALLTLAPADLKFGRLSTSTGDLSQAVPGNQQTACQIFDIDGDGINDIVVAERTQAPSVVALVRRGDRWVRQVIDADKLRPEAGGAYGDLDDDGDLDLVFGGDAGSNQVWWWENPGAGAALDQPWTRRLIKTSGGGKHHDQALADVDGDGRLELASWNQKDQRLLLFEIPDHPRTDAAWPVRTIYEWQGGREHEGLAACDVDGDGVVDLVGGGKWFQHGAGGKFKARTIDPRMAFTRAAAGQLVPGGYAEVVFVPGDADGPLTWYSTTDGENWTPHVIRPMVIHGHSLHLIDFDGDGHLDIWCGEMHTPGHGAECTAWVFFGDGAGEFTERVMDRGVGYHEARPADLDGDGDVDVLVKPYTAGAPRVEVLIRH